MRSILPGLRLTSTASVRAAPTGQRLSAGGFDELVAAIRPGVTYVNVHSTLWPAGEIRGQITNGERQGGGAASARSPTGAAASKPNLPAPGGR
jgi:hypothetical protein